MNAHFIGVFLKVGRYFPFSYKDVNVHKRGNRHLSDHAEFGMIRHYDYLTPCLLNHTSLDGGYIKVQCTYTGFEAETIHPKKIGGVYLSDHFHGQRPYKSMHCGVVSTGQITSSAVIFTVSNSDITPCSSLKLNSVCCNLISGFRLFAVAVRQANMNDIYPYNSV